MDASAALDRLQEISSQVRHAVVFDRDGTVIGSTLEDDRRSEQIAREARELLDDAAARGHGEGEFAQLEVALQRGSVFVVRHDDRLIAATTAPEPTVGLVFYDLKSTLRELEQPARPGKRAAAKSDGAGPKAKPTPKPRAKPRPRGKKGDEKP
jgi:predicted regulator of Ras-like GTPase activity (Roadblock/LC7/MglB family)